MLRKFSATKLTEDDISAMDFGETAMWLRKENKNGTIPDEDYICFFRDYFTDVKLDQIRQNVLRLPWKNISAEGILVRDVPRHSTILGCSYNLYGHSQIQHPGNN